MNLDRIELELEQMERNGKILRGYIVLGNVLCGIILLAVAIFAPHAVNAPPPVMKVRVMVGVLGLILFGIAIAIRRVKP